MEISVIQAPNGCIHKCRLRDEPKGRCWSGMAPEWSEGMQVSALPPVWIAMIISCWSVKLLKLPSVTLTHVCGTNSHNWWAKGLPGVGVVKIFCDSDSVSTALVLIPLYCNQRGKARGSSEPILICCLPGWTLNPAGISQGGMHCGKHGCESSNVCWWYICVQPQY